MQCSISIQRDGGVRYITQHLHIKIGLRKYNSIVFGGTMTTKDRTPKFNTSDQFLTKTLFTPNIPKYGDQLRFKVQYLPNLVENIKQYMLPEERNSLIDYALQCYILDLAHVSEEPAGYQSNTESLREFILNHLRSNSSYWIKHSEIWNKLQQEPMHQQQEKLKIAMETYMKNIADINEQCADYKESVQSFYEPRRKQIITQDYGFFNRYPEQSYQRIDYLVMLEIYGFIKQEYKSKACDLLRAQYYLLDMVLTEEEPRRKRSRGQTFVAGSFKEATFLKFEKHASKRLKLPEVIIEAKSEPFIITNIIKGFEVMQNSKFVPKEGVTKQDYQQLMSKMEERLLKPAELTNLVSFWHRVYDDEKTNIQEIKSLNSHKGIPGCLNSPDQIAKVKQELDNALNNPHYKGLDKHRFNFEERINWTEDMVKKFLQGLLVHLKTPVNNKKIAAMMGGEVQPHHIRFVKNLYFKGLKNRRSNRKGGRNQVRKSKAELIKEDIDNFDMKNFEFTNTSSDKVIARSRAIKRKRRNLSHDEDGSDSFSS